MVQASEQTRRPTPTRPPGAVRPEAAFVAACAGTTGCTACVEACPYDAIEVLGPEAGDAEGTPFLRVATNPCRWCQPMVCIEACEPGALAFDAKGAAPAIARVALDLSACLTSEGTLCSDCSSFCPPSVRAMTTSGRQPKLDAARCVGCGMCAWHCDATGDAITVLPLEA